MRLFAILLRSRVNALAVLLLAAAGVVAALAPAPPEALSPASRTDLADASVESVRAERLQEELPTADASTALLVWEREDGDPLTPDDVAALEEAVSAATTELPDGVLAPAVEGRVPPAQPSPDGSVALVPLPLAPVEGGPDEASAAVVAQVGDLRGALAAAAPADLAVGVTGAPAFTADLGAVFEGADLRLLVATAAIVAVLLLVTYRSPLLVLVPLAVVAATEQTTLALVAQVLPRLELPGGGQVTGITSVLVFGAATDYALLLIARYREQLRREDSPLLAMRTALARSWEAVAASGGTVVIALAVLLLASTQTLRAIAVACAVGVVLAVVAALVVLPAALVLLGRRAFWPFVPRVGDPAREGRVWGALGDRVARAPVRVLLASAVLLLALASGALGLRTGLAQDEQFVDPPEAVTAAERLDAALPAGATSPVAVLTTPADVDAVVRAATSVPGVAGASPGPSGGGVAQVDVVLEAEPGSTGSGDAVRALRAELDGVGAGDAVVGGGPAEFLDTQEAADRDRAVVLPLVLLLVGLVLVALLRSLLAPVLLVTTVAATFGASLGASWLLFEHVLGFPALEASVVVLAFLFLVALGVDYNIFLTTRAREEAATTGTRAGVLTALRVTGGVITSAGVLLAAVFAVLGVLPLIALAQVGTIVCLGVLLDTLLVRTIVVPALVVLLGERFWWPSRPAVVARHAR